jgi:DNA-binding response OmpR family regulator
VATVLVVEDSEPLGRMLSQTLSRAGHNAYWAATGAAAIEHARAALPDVVLVDLHLADATGTELAGRLRAQLPGCRLIGVSGEAPPSDVVRQFDAFLLKPVGLDTLLGAVSGPGPAP